MKLISCHIENFGKLHDYSVDFADGTNIICEENGWGKSTFAAFIRAMFYGLEGERKRSIEENERKRYKPWQGGIFGGQLLFEAQGKQYEVSRIFYDKEAQDEFEIRDAKTNLPTKDYTKKLGEELFQINRESFIRTIFIGQDECGTAPTDDINAKIGNLTDNSNDMNNFEAANARLTEIINRLNPSRATGSIAKRAGELTGLERLVQDGMGISGTIDTYQDYLQAESESYGQLKEQLKETGEKQTKVTELQRITAKKTEWNRLKKAVETRREELAEAKAKFPGDIPPVSDVKKHLADCSSMVRSAERAASYLLTDAEETEFSDLQNLFAQNVPESAEIQEMLSQVRTLGTLCREFSAEQLTPGEEARLEALEGNFSNDTESVSFISAKWNNRNTKKAALPSNQAALAALKATIAVPEKEKKKAFPKILGILFAAMGMILTAVGIGIILIAADTVTALSFSAIPGLIAAAIGAILLTVGLFTVQKQRTPRSASHSAPVSMPPEFISLQQAIEEDTFYIQEADEEVAAYLFAHEKIFDETTVSASLQELTEEYIEYTALRKKAQKAAASGKSAEIASTRERVCRFLETYGVLPSDARFTDDLYLIQSKSDRYAVLQNKKEKFKESDASYQSVCHEISSFLKKYGFVPLKDFDAQMRLIKDDLDTYQNLLKSYTEASDELAAFEEANPDMPDILAKELPEEELPSLEELNRKIMELTAEMESSHNTIIGYNKTLEGLRIQYDEWEENRVKLEEQTVLQQIEKTKYDHVLKARLYLGLAKESITAKYADPILKSFSKYYEMLTNAPADKFRMDANTSVTIEESGKQRETNTLSFGYRDLIGICLRIALVDAMYTEETPLLVMDDPFANLDDEKLAAGKRFLEEVAKKYQVVYFTCCSSRR